MNGKRKIYFIVECIAILIGVLSFLGALPIKKLSFLWLLAVFCGIVRFLFRSVLKKGGTSKVSVL